MFDSLGVESWHDTLAKARTLLKAGMRRPTALAHIVASKIWIHEYDYEEAIAAARRAIAMDPNNPDAHEALAIAHVWNGQPSAAIKEIEIAVRRDPHYPAVYLGVFGLAEFALGNFDRAAQYFERRRTRNPQTGVSLSHLLAAYGQLGRIDDGVQGRHDCLDYRVAGAVIRSTSRSNGRLRMRLRMCLRLCVIHRRE